MSTMSDFAAERRPAIVPGRGRLPSRGGGRGFAVLAVLGSVALVALMLGGFLGPEADAPVPSAPPAPGWEEIVAPVPLFRLATTDFGRGAPLYEARRNKAGGGRQDFLTFGGDFPAAPYLRLALYRVGQEKAPRVDFFVDLTRTAALGGLSVIRSGLPAPLVTRLGAFDVAELGVTDGTIERTCFGFRSGAGSQDVRLAGFACANGGGLERAQLACLLDRWEATGAPEEPQVAALLGKAAGETACPRPQTGLRSNAALQKILPVPRKGAVPAPRTAVD
jgi:hypothetical protein